MVTPITKVSGVGAQTAEVLVENGFENAEVLAAAKEEDLLKISGFGPSKAKKFIEAAQALVGAGGDESVVEVEVATETVTNVEAKVEKTETETEKSSGPKVCTQKFAKAKKKKDKKSKKKKKKGSRKKKSK